ncbi:MAG: hypothetical protein J5939_02045 [Bacteroidales bacterium]|nr:hypothetical protein [Bacteroidales bacterium]
MEEAIDTIWHVYSDGVRADIPFDTEEDKVFGWNSVAICAEIVGVRVWVVTVNDTHLHVLACCDGVRAERFKCLLQQRLQRHFPGDNIHLACDPVTKREDVLSKFMYVYRNCLDFYRKLPGEYPWGCGHLYFSEKRHFYKGRRVDWLSGREQYRMFRTKHPIPQHWRFQENGRILPESFVDFEAVERFFRSARTFIAFLYVRKEDEAAMKQEIYRNYMESRSIQELRKIGNRYSVNYCGRTLPKTTLEIRLKVALRLLREGLSSKSASLAKALYLKPEDLYLLV